LLFVDCLLYRNHPVFPGVYSFIVQQFLDSNQNVTLAQLIACGKIPASFSVAKILGSCPNRQPENTFMATSMLSRISEHEAVIEMLTEKSFIYEAIEYAKTHNCISALKPVEILNHCQQTDSAMFLNAYRFFEQHGIIPFATDISNIPPKLARHVSVLREMWSNRIEMELV
jgi:hypothetical protein